MRCSHTTAQGCISQCSFCHWILKCRSRNCATLTPPTRVLYKRIAVLLHQYPSPASVMRDKSGGFSKPLKLCAFYENSNGISMFSIWVKCINPDPYKKRKKIVLTKKKKFLTKRENNDDETRSSTVIISQLIDHCSRAPWKISLDSRIVFLRRSFFYAAISFCLEFLISEFQYIMSGL